jgi:hypothetical protein
VDKAGTGMRVCVGAFFFIRAFYRGPDACG